MKIIKPSLRLTLSTKSHESRVDMPLLYNLIMGFSDKLDAFSENREGDVFLKGILISVVSEMR